MRFPPLHHEKVVDMISRCGFEPSGQLIPLGCLENRVFWAPTVSGDDLVVKVYRPGRWDVEQLDEEHEVLFECEDQGIEVVAPKDLGDGYTLDSLSSEGIDCSCAIFPFIQGRMRDELDLDQLEQLGDLIARMHQVLASRSKDTMRRPKDNLEALEIWLDSHLNLPVHFRQRAQFWVRQIHADGFLSELQWIHGDCHLGNMIWNDEGPWLIDFDDVGLGWFGQDLWLVAPGVSHEQTKKRAALFAGYGQSVGVGVLDERLPLLKALRMLNYTRWLSERWGDPSFLNAYPDFGTESFWSKECEALDELNL